MNRDAPRELVEVEKPFQGEKLDSLSKRSYDDIRMRIYSLSSDDLSSIGSSDSLIEDELNSLSDITVTNVTCSISENKELIHYTVEIQDILVYDKIAMNPPAFTGKMDKMDIRLYSFNGSEPYFGFHVSYKNSDIEDASRKAKKMASWLNEVISSHNEFVRNERDRLQKLSQKWFDERLRGGQTLEAIEKSLAEDFMIAFKA